MADPHCNPPSPMSRRLLMGGLAAVAGCGFLGSREAPAPEVASEPDRAPRPSPRSRGSAALQRVDLTVDGHPRRGAIALPSSYDGRTPLPLVVAVHGSKNVPRSMYEANGWGRALDEAGWIGVFPETGHGGNPEGGRGDNPLLEALVARAIDRYAVDTSRIAVTGFSGGCRSAYIFGIANPTRVRAIAGVSGSIMIEEDPDELTDPVRAGVRELSVLHIHGGRDAKVKLDGGAHESLDGRIYHHVPTRQALRRWAEACGAAREVPAARHPACPRRAEVVRLESPSGRVVQYVIDPELGHEWPRWATPLVRDWLAERMA